MVQGRREEVIPQERQKMAREHQEEVMVQGRREMDRGAWQDCRRELPEQMIARRCRTGCRRKKMATCRAMQHRTEQEVTVKKRRAEMAGMSGESVTTLIPVSTVVHTTAGTETTFQRLAAGDLLKLLIVTSEDGEEVIIEIWMQ